MNIHSTTEQSSFSDSFKATRIIESLENYCIADNLKFSEIKEKPIDDEIIRNERSFWEMILKSPNTAYGKSYSFDNFIITSWIPRIPGLYWSNNGELLRKVSTDQIENSSPHHLKYTPYGKSSMVMGGIGTLKFNPDSENNRVFCLSSEGNSSMGIPIILNNEQWRKLSIMDGYSVCVGNAKWTPMRKEWEMRFPFVHGIPRAYLVLDDKSDIDVYDDTEQYEYHPFSIMEYTTEHALLYDYVFCTVYQSEYDNNENQAIDFFEKYRRDRGREGEYLIAAEPEGKLFKSRYASPDELVRQDSSGLTLLNLIEKRVRNAYFSGIHIDLIIKRISAFYQAETSIKRIAQISGISPTLLKSDKTAVMVAQLVDICIHQNKLESLLQSTVIEHPEILTYN